MPDVTPVKGDIYVSIDGVQISGVTDAPVEPKKNTEEITYDDDDTVRRAPTTTDASFNFTFVYDVGSPVDPGQEDLFAAAEDGEVHTFVRGLTGATGPNYTVIGYPVLTPVDANPNKNLKFKCEVIVNGGSTFSLT